MAHQMMITLSDDEYQALQNAATQAGKPLEDFVYEALAPHMQSLPQPQPLSGQALMQQLYRAGKIMNLPARQPLTPTEQAERDRLAQKLGQGKPLSKIVIEERGPKA
jgi:hypothetical protein